MLRICRIFSVDLLILRRHSRNKTADKDGEGTVFFFFVWVKFVRSGLYRGQNLHDPPPRPPISLGKDILTLFSSPCH